MTTREKTWLAIGILMGGVLAASVLIGRRYIAPRQAPALAAADAAPAADTAADTAADALPDAGTGASVQLTDQEQQAIGVEIVEVHRQTIRKKTTAPGKVVEPETGIRTISARIGGRIDRLSIQTTGETVSRGQAVALIYSPEVFTAGEEYRLALENRRRLSASKESQAITEADDLVRASRRRLELWGLSPQEVEEIASSPERAVQITTYSDASGVVTKRNVAEGQYVKEGDVLFELADLSTAWIEADIFESDIPLIRAGQRVKISAPTLAGGALQGTISFLLPSVDPQTRTMQARIQTANPQMRLRPGMFVQVAMETALDNQVVAVPRSAVIDTGKEKVVYVARGNGVFEKRAVEASSAGDEYYAVTKGIEPGERVVTHGNFLIDSQTRLTGTISGMFGGSKAFGGESNGAKGETSKYAITLQSEPSPLKGGSDATFHVKVNGPDGKPIRDAQVRLTLLMPAMPSMGMGEMRSSVELAWNGSEYVGKAPIPTAGSWTITVEASRGGELLGVYRTRLDAK